MHNETSNSIQAYKRKWFHYSYGAMPFLIRYNLPAAKNLPIFFLENLDNKIYKKISLFIFRVIFNKIVINTILFYLTITDKNRLFYVSILYKIVLFRAYIDGIYARKNKKKLNQSDTKNDWYGEGYK